MNGSRLTDCFHSLTALFLITDLISISALFIWPQQLVVFPEEYRDHTDCFLSIHWLSILSTVAVVTGSKICIHKWISIHVCNKTYVTKHPESDSKPWEQKTISLENCQTHGGEQERWSALSKSLRQSGSWQFKEVGHETLENKVKKKKIIIFSLMWDKILP